MIEVRHLKKKYPGVTPLRDVNTVINKGEVISVIGPSGTGKSTLLRCLNLLERPSAGEILINGENILDKHTDVPALRRKMGMVFQSFNLWDHLSVIENIIIGPVLLLKKTRQEAYDEGIKLLETVGLLSKAKSLPSELSGGQKQRVAIVRALAMNPEIMLFDEPTSALDPTMVGEVESVIRTLKDKGMTMIIVTHEMSFAESISTRVFYMDDGVIYEDGTPDQIFNNPKTDRCRAFTRRMKLFEKTINDRHFDFYEINSEIEVFGRSRLMNQAQILSAKVIFEEIFVQNILPVLGDRFNFTFSLGYSDTSGECEIRMKYSGERYDPLTQGDDLSLKIALHRTQNAVYTYEDGQNITVFKL